MFFSCRIRGTIALLEKRNGGEKEQTCRSPSVKKTNALSSEKGGEKKSSSGEAPECLLSISREQDLVIVQHLRASREKREKEKRGIRRGDG